jgi:integrase
VPITDEVVETLAALKSGAKSGFVFPGPGRLGHLTDVKKVWTSLCETAQISSCRIHDLRHSFASVLVSNGVGLPVIGSLLGHSQPSTTMRYAHLFDGPQRAAAEFVAKAGLSET